MKELSIEQKAKAYDEAKLRMSAAYNSNRCTIGFMNEIFPELKESEGERMKRIISDILLVDNDEIRKILDANKVLIQDVHAWLEKQGEQSIKWHKNTEGNKPQKNHSVLIKTTHGIAEGEWNGGNHWIQYRWSGSIKDSDVLFWIELSDIEKQSEQKPYGQREECSNCQMNYAGQYKGSCAMKRGEQKPAAWSEEDEKMCAAILQLITDSEKENGWNCVYCNDKEIYFSDIIAWLKSLKQRYTWKLSDEQMSILRVLSLKCQSERQFDIIGELIEQLKVLQDDTKSS